MTPAEQPPGDGPERKRGTLPESLRTLGALSTVGLSFVIAIVLGAAFGLFLMRQFGVGRWAFFLFFFLGLAAGVLNVYRTAAKFLK
jgi:ATP synthase protein I